MADQPTPEAMNKMLFVNMVMMLSTTAMQHLGKLKNPVSGNVEVDLDGAQLSIDMLSMLRDKTRGNLDGEEERMMDQTLSTLQLNYVETAAAQPQPAAGDKDQAAPEAKPAGEGDAAQAESGAKGAPPKDPKFHKTYGS